MTKTWVDFGAIKAAVPISLALEHYGVNWLRKNNRELRGRCPIHKGEGEDAFHVNVEKNCFQCFSCKVHGNVLDFVAAMERCSVRDAGLKLQAWFSLSEQDEKPQASTMSKTPAPSGGEEPSENKPLTFQLKGIDPHHPYLVSRGIRPETAEVFGVGYFGGKGSMSGRVVIPIHNERGELVAYVGRAIDGSEPKYKLPAGFHKSRELYNVHRAVQDNEPRLVVIVEGFFDCMKVYEAGFPAVALMGCSLSVPQEDLLATKFRGGWLLLDGDDAGKSAGVDIAARLARRMFMKVVELPSGKQPDMLTPAELGALVV